MADDEADDTVTYQFDVPRTTWERWTATVPRTTTLYERLWSLLRQDTQATTSEGFSDMEERTARLLTSRIEQRAVNAGSALDDGDEARAREELTAIKDIAGQFDT